MSEVFHPDESTEPAHHEPLATTADLWHTFDDLTRPKTVRLARRDCDWLAEIHTQRDGACSVARYHAATSERVVLPSLFDQLIAAVESGAGGRAHGVQESKPPLDAAALALLIDIADHVRSGCWNWRIKRQHDTPKDLKAVVSAVIGNRNPREIDQTVRKIRSWVSQIKATISSEADRTWRMHGAACTVCGSTTVPAWLDDGTETRQPALIVHSDDGVIGKVECGFCGSILTGDDLTAMVRDALGSTADRKTG